MTVRVILTSYQKSWDLSKDQILSLIPNSIISQALQEEPDVPEIILNHPDVTPEALNVIADIMKGYNPPHHSPNLVSAARYLNVPSLLLYADPFYDLIEKPVVPGETYDTPKNQGLLERAIQTGRNTMLEYLLSKGVSPVTPSNEASLISRPLTMAINIDNLEAFQILLAVPKVREAYPLETIMNILFADYEGCVTSKIQDYIILTTTSADLFSIIESECLYVFISNLYIVKKIYDRAETPVQKELLLCMACETEKYNIVRWLYEQ